MRLPGSTHAQRVVGWLGVLLAAAGVLGACEKSAPPAPPPMDVLVADVVQKDVPVYYEWIGTLTGFVNAQIRPQVTGYLLTQNYDNGDFVKEGQLLFQIDPRQFQAAVEQGQGNLAHAEALLVKTNIDVKRYTPLAAQGAVSQQELDNAVQADQANKAAVDTARAALEQAKLNLSWTKVLSPIDGVAGIAIAQIGNLVEPTTELTTVSTLNPIKVKFPVAEQEYLRFAKAHPERIREGKGEKDALELILADGSIFPHRGTVEVIGREVDPRTGTLAIEGYFPNPENVLRPGGYAKVRAVIDKLPGASVVPASAVQDFQGAMQLAVVTPENKVEMRNVTTGPRFGTDWVITDGVKPGDRVIVEGLQKVRGGMTVNAKPFVAPAAPPTPTPAPF